MIDVAFRELLLADTATAAIVGTQIWFNNRPQDVRSPGIVLILAGSEPFMTMQGESGAYHGHMQVNVLTPTFATTKQLAAAVRKAIDGYRGVQDGTTIQWAEIEDQKDIPAKPLQGAGAAATYGVQLDALFIAKGA
jgi:Protein of unknown function (DUF3168)